MKECDESSLPPKWTRATLGQMVRVLRGVSYQKQDARDRPGHDLVPILRATNIQNGGHLCFDGLVYVPSRYVSQDQRMIIGDIVVVTSSGSRSVVGKTAQLHEEWMGSFGAFCCALRPHASLRDRYLGYYLQTEEYRNMISGVARGVNINNLQLGQIDSAPILLAPLGEQSRIVSEIEKQLTRLDAAVVALNCVRAKLKRYRASVLKAACEGRLVPTEAELARREGRSYEPASVPLERILKERRSVWEAEQLKKMRVRGLRPRDEKWKAKYRGPEHPNTSILPSIPDGWEWVTVDCIADSRPNAITDGPFGSNLKTSHYTAEGPRVIRLQNIGDGVFLDEKAHIALSHFEHFRKHRVEAGDLVIAALSAHPPRACVIPPDVGPAIVKADCVRIRPHQGLTVSVFLNTVLNADPTRRRTERLVHGVGRPRLNLQEIKSLALPLPPRAEQERIAAEVERLLSLVQSMERAIEVGIGRADRLRQAILKHAYSGKLVPQDPADEPASALLDRIRAERAILDVNAKRPKPPRRRSTGRKAREVRT
jgi:type I restriction enzyme S subunit